jgi:hypothetical protein
MTTTATVPTADRTGRAKALGSFQRRIRDVCPKDRVSANVESRTRSGKARGAVSWSQVLIRSSTGRSMFIV